MITRRERKKLNGPGLQVHLRRDQMKFIEKTSDQVLKAANMLTYTLIGAAILYRLTKKK